MIIMCSSTLPIVAPEGENMVEYVVEPNFEYDVKCEIIFNVASFENLVSKIARTWEYVLVS
jgi:hypothetical protein